MADFRIRAESLDVEQIMQQIRSRIAEKRGVDYTEAQIREIATVRLEKFLDPRSVRSDLLEHFRRSRPSIDEDSAAFEAACSFNDQTLFWSHRAPMRFIRRLLMPIFKLFFNPNVLNHVLHTQSNLNVTLLTRMGKWNALQYEVMHNLVLETTRLSIEVKNLKVLVQSLSGRVDLDQRRARALEAVVQYRPDAITDAAADDEADDNDLVDAPSSPPSEGATHSRRRRRRGR
jgi:hypothetical protein